jgi:hypothetical protein
MSRIRLNLKISEDRAAGTARILHATLFDASEADGLHDVKAVMRCRVSELGRWQGSLYVPDDVLGHSRRYSLFVHVGPSSEGAFLPGDLVTVVDIPVSLQDLRSGATIDVPLSLI